MTEDKMISIVLAMTEKGRVIGKDNDLPWKGEIKGELEHFRKITKGGVIVMGRRTYESIGYPLPGRPNIVVSRSASAIEGCEVAPSVKEAIELGKKHGKDIFLIGGAGVVKEALEQDLADTMQLSFIKKEYEGDTFFPEFDESEWAVSERVDHGEWEYVVYKRKDDSLADP